MKGRTIIKTNQADFETYDLEGPIQENMSLLKLSYNKERRQGAYMMRLQPGAVTIAHTHKRREEFLILEGDIVESDGTRLAAGDYVIYEPGTHHNSRTEGGCVLIGFDWSLTEE